MTNEQPVALITGSAKRIGAALVRRFHDAGYRLIIHYNGSEEEALSLQAERNAVRAAVSYTHLTLPTTPYV